MHLGALIAQLEQSRDATQLIEALGDVVLFAKIAEVAERYGERPGEYLAASVGQFASGAGDEDWLGLVAAMERTDDPGRAAVRWILDWAIARDTAPPAPTRGCSCTSTLI